MQSRLTCGKWRLRICQPNAISPTSAPQTTWRIGLARGYASGRAGAWVWRRQSEDAKAALESHELNASQVSTADTVFRSIYRSNLVQPFPETTQVPRQDGSSEKHHSAALAEQGGDIPSGGCQAGRGKLSETAARGFGDERPARMVVRGKPTTSSERPKLIWERISARNRSNSRFKTAIRPATKRTTAQSLKEPGYLSYSELELRRMRSSPSIIVDALKRGRLTLKSRSFNLHAWSTGTSATGMAMKYMLGLSPPELATLRTEAREAGDRLISQGTSSSGFRERFLERLNKKGYTKEDIHEWAKIALAPQSSRALLYLESESAMPPHAIFNAVLRDSTLDVRTLRMMTTSCRLTLAHFAERKSVTEAGTLQDNQFITLFNILMTHARRIAPSMLPKSIAPLIIEYCQIVERQETSNARKANRLHKICNAAVVKFSLTPKRQPLEGMEYAWKAQAKILELGDSFEPSLILDAPTYRAIIRVLLACKKTEWEEHAVTHLHRTWPPWRKTQDGMDARIQPDDELTRVVSVVRNLIRAGHPRTSFDNMAMILGGRDVDGTPTIPTRTILKSKYPKSAYDPQNTNADLEWAARVRATRDIREAWGAFLACQNVGLKPTQGMYEEMIEKLVYDHRRESGITSTPRIPGAGRETMHFHNENFSETELQRTSPPSIAELLERMKVEKIKLSEKSLCLLVRGAKSPKHARQLMLDYGIGRFAVLQLSRGRRMQNVEDGQQSVEKFVPENILTAYLQMLCRFSSYSLTRPGSRPGREYLLDVTRILECAPHLRVAWHTFLKTVALVKKSPHGNSYDFSHSSKLWILLQDALLHRRKQSFVDADNFGYACYGLYNALEGEKRGYPMEARVKKEGIDFINGLWSYLTEVLGEEQSDAYLPTLLSVIKGWQLHAYVRLLARTGQKEQIKELLEWMTKHENELDNIATTRANGLIGLRRTLIAMRVYAISTRDVDFEDELREITESIPQDWGGWATDVEVEEYVDYQSDAEVTREIDPNVRMGWGIMERGGEQMFSSAENRDESSRNTMGYAEDGTVMYRPM